MKDVKTENRSQADDTDQTEKSAETCAQPLPEASRPRRDGPGGD